MKKIDCDNCNGTGEVPGLYSNTYTRCYQCNGTGVECYVEDCPGTYQYISDTYLQCTHCSDGGDYTEVSGGQSCRRTRVV